MASGEEDGTVEEKETNNKKRTKGAIATAWLTFYNIAMTAGWLVLAVAMARYYLQKGTHKGLYKNIARTLKFFQTFALLEVGHCAIGIVRTSVIVTGVQVCSRIFMVWFITNSIRQIQNEESVILFVVVWTITEITRYSFYTFNLLNHLPYFIKWARYFSELYSIQNFDCVAMVRSPEKMTGVWKVKICGDQHNFICKRKTDPQLAGPVTTALPQHFFTLANDSYKVQTEKMSWDEARRQCKADDADLASVLDSISQAYTILRVSKLKEPLWIGLNSNLTLGRYRWVDNWLLSYSKWATGEPKNNLACVYIDTDGDWKTAACSNKYYSLCKRSTDIAPTDPPQMPGNCPESKKRKTWIPFRGHCYVFMASMSDNWAHATVECMRMGASLVSIEDPIESAFIQRNIEIMQDGVKSFWIGMHRSHMGEWMWIDNIVVDYTNWKPRMPSDFGSCVEVQSSTGMWSTTNCNSYKPYICKTVKVIPPTEKPSIPRFPLWHGLLERILAMLSVDGDVPENRSDDERFKVGKEILVCQVTC
ncbi:hypothetical protein QQF64_029827 [Cirrhinus molitorella]|uniref:very-long-chain (3R)-3-hydroxyacyl-CoA dehydratase n=1 Tax=Cirrhinus molitorella TaxID=172907 RepID=A0ABR3N1X0_9TELE